MENDVTQPETVGEDPAPAGQKAAPESAEASLEDRLARAEENAARYLDNWRRAEADFQNYKKRADQERDEQRRFAGVSIILNLLPIVDDFERAFSSLDVKLAGLTWLEGMRMIYRKLLALLDAAGVQPIKTEGEMFDPRVHEAVAHAEGPEGKVISEVQRGYMLHDRVLRPAMVVVGKGAEKPAGKDSEEAPQ